MPEYDKYLPEGKGIGSHFIFHSYLCEFFVFQTIFCVFATFFSKMSANTSEMNRCIQKKSNFCSCYIRGNELALNLKKARVGNEKNEKVFQSA